MALRDTLTGIQRGTFADTHGWMSQAGLTLGLNGPPSSDSGDRRRQFDCGAQHVAADAAETSHAVPDQTASTTIRAASTATGPCQAAATRRR